MITIRPSMIPSYSDCARRAASSSGSIRELIEQAGYTLKQSRKSIGAAVGTSVHEAARYAYEAKINGADLPSIPDSAELAISRLDKETQEEVIYDDTTSSKNAAQQQVKILVGILYEDVISKKNPLKTENRRKANIIEGFQTSGSPDLEEVDGCISDLKTGRKLGIYFGQLGDYSLIKKSHDGVSASSLVIDYMPRFNQKKAYPGTRRIVYDVRVCEIVAHNVSRRIIQDVKAFQSTANPWCFLANPMSMLCSDKYCPAWGTNFCEFGGQS